MAVSAETVTIEILARIDQAEADIKRLGATFQATAVTVNSAANDVEVSARKAGAAASGIAIGANAASAALAEMGDGGQIAALGATALEGALTGGLSVAITAGVSLLGLLASHLLGAGDAAEDAADKGLKAFQDRQAEMGRFIDQTTGKLIAQNRVLAQIAAQQLPDQIKAKNDESQGFVNQAFGAARAYRSAEKPFNVRSGRYEQGDAALDQAIASSGSKSTSLLRNVNALVAKGRADLAPLAGQIAALEGRAAEASLSVLALKGQQVDLNTALSGGTVVTGRMIEREVALATAHDGVKKAQLALDAVRDKREGIDARNAGPAKTAALNAYRLELTAAENAVTAAERARDAAKEAAEARKKAAREGVQAAKEEQRALEAAFTAGRRMLIQFNEHGLDTKRLGIALPKFGDLTDVHKQLDDSERRRQSQADEEAAPRIHAEYQIQRIQEQGVKTLAGLYYDLFQGNTKSIWQTFEQMGLQALAKLAAKQTAAGIPGLLGGLSKLFGGGSPTVMTNPQLTSSLSGIKANLPDLSGGIFGRASGGYVGAGALVRINEGASPGNVEGWKPQGSGEIIPLGRMKTAQGGGTVIHQHFNLDARFGITTPELLDYVHKTADGAAARGAAAGSSMAQAALERRARSRLG